VFRADVLRTRDGIPDEAMHLNGMKCDPYPSRWR
jgi:hypothetical protein